MEPYVRPQPTKGHAQVRTRLDTLRCLLKTKGSLQDLLRKYQDDIARSIVLEQGKTLADAKGDVLRGIQVVEAACALPQLTMGEKLEVSKDMDTETRKVPLGVTAAICPYAASLPPDRLLLRRSPAGSTFRSAPTHFKRDPADVLRRR